MSERVAIVVGAGGDLGRVTAEKLAAGSPSPTGVSTAALVHLTRVLDLELRPLGIG